jgi:ribosomal protein L11 methylase PrmA
MIEVQLALPAEARPDEFDRALDLLLGRGALDVELVDRRIFALFSDGADLSAIADLHTEPARMLDQGNTWARKLRPRLEVGGFALSIDPGETFGTGVHPTTRLCLERLLESRPPRSLLDVGTGSGVLAIFALAIGADRAVAIDDDPRALEIAAVNAKANGFEGRLELHAPPVRGRFDTVVANIVPAVLTALAPEIVRALEPEGRVILSGLMARHRDAILATYRDLGLRPAHESERGGWLCLELRAPW